MGKGKVMGVAGGVALAGAAVWMLKSSRAGTESAPYETLRADGDFEVRRYPDLAVASTSAPEGVRGPAFMRLFRFIDKGNARGEKIAMTTPVFTQPGPGGTMSFVVPAEVAPDVPAPADPAVQLGRRPAAVVAAYRFDRAATERNESEATARLRAWMAGRGLRPAGEATFAYYDAPWVPWPFRRSEVLIPLAKAEAAG